MDTIFNFGDPHKDFEPIAKSVLGEYNIYQIPITNNRVFCNDKVQIVDACYGPSMVLDSLSMLKAIGKIHKNEHLVFLGSMGSLTGKIDLNDIVIPSKIYCNYFEFKGKTLRPSENLKEKLISVLNKIKINFKQYNHGSVRAVFDPTTDHKDYTSSLYGQSVIGIDCSETYFGIDFCNKNDMGGIALLYCSDDPKKHISDLSKEGFDARALKFDKLLNSIAYKVLTK